MTGRIDRPLIAAHDAPPVTIINPGGTSSFLLIGDHAGNAVPSALAGLGLGESELARHIGWDIGIGVIGPLLAARLDAVFVRQTYSRLVVDCNRSQSQPDAIAEVSDGTVIPGNANLSDLEKTERFAAIHEPYQAAIAGELDRRDASGQATILVALHSFTPAMRGPGATQGTPRPWHVGILHDRGDTRFATAMLDVLAQETDLTTGDNEPYRMDLIDYTIPRHAYPTGRLYAEIEIRQDLLATPADCARWADRLAIVLNKAAQQLGIVSKSGAVPR